MVVRPARRFFALSEFSNRECRSEPAILSPPGYKSFPFIRDEDAARFEAGCKERSVRVHYRPDKPKVSALARESMPS
jgi:hypothetical protein